MRAISSSSYLCVNRCERWTASSICCPLSPPHICLTSPQTLHDLSWAPYFVLPATTFLFPDAYFSPPPPELCTRISLTRTPLAFTAVFELLRTPDTLRSRETGENDLRDEASFYEWLSRQLIPISSSLEFQRLAALSESLRPLELVVQVVACWGRGRDGWGGDEGAAGGSDLCADSESTPGI